MKTAHKVLSRVLFRTRLGDKVLFWLERRFNVAIVDKGRVVFQVIPQDTLALERVTLKDPWTSDD